MNNQPINLPDDVVLSVRGVSKKFCRNLRRSMWYGIQDLGCNLLGIRPKAGDHRLQTIDPRLEVEEGIDGDSVLSQSKVQGQKSKVSLPCEAERASCLVRGASCEELPATNQAPRTKNEELPPLRRDEFWALRDINFDVKRGEAVGIIGLNGSGKTTLFRVIHGLFPPDQGEIVVRGRIGALIALGAGFHPHMTGRENIYLNGAILGISQEEIRERMEEIVDFAEIGEFIDAPVSTYSSGMRVRLGFAVAVNMNPDILLIDEVLAVGDLAFRNKCFEYMRTLQSANRTMLFVSHNMLQVSLVCQKAILLEDGRVAASGEVDEVIGEYYRRVNASVVEQEGKSMHNVSIPHVYHGGEVTYRGSCLFDEAGRPIKEIPFGSWVMIRIEIDVHEDIQSPWVIVFFDALTPRTRVAYAIRKMSCEFREGRRFFELIIPSMRLHPGAYKLGSRLTEDDMLKKLAGTDELGCFQVVPNTGQLVKTNENGFFEIEGDWQYREEVS